MARGRKWAGIIAYTPAQGLGIPIPDQTYPQDVLGGSPIGYWRFEEKELPTTNKLTDTSPYGRHATVTTPAAYKTGLAGVYGIEGSYAARPNNSGAANVTLPLPINGYSVGGGSAIAAEAWVYIDPDATGIQTILECTTFSMYYDVNDGKVVCVWRSTRSNSAPGSSSTPITYKSPFMEIRGSWTHVVFYAANYSSYLMVNGVATWTQTGNYVSSDDGRVGSTLIRVGSQAGGVAPLKGKVDEIAIYAQSSTTAGAYANGQYGPYGVPVVASFQRHYKRALNLPPYAS